MACYLDLTVDITKLPNYTKIKQVSDLATVILRGNVNFGNGKKELTLQKTSGSNLIFLLTNLEKINTLNTLNFSILKIKNHKTYIFIQHTKS